MIAEQQEQSSSKQRPSKKWLTWLNIILAVLLVVIGLWYLSREITLAEILHALSLANPAYIALALLVIAITLIVKTWRWQLLFYPPKERPSFTPTFWAIMLGQFVNLIVSFLRLGELARVYALYQQTGISNMKSLGTLVVEKTLDFILLILTLFILLPFVVVPDYMTDSGLPIGLASLLFFVVLYLLAYQTQKVAAVFEYLAKYLPHALQQRVIRWTVSGLEGLAALRDPRTTLLLLLSSALIALLSVMTSLVLFPAFGLPYGWREAALIHVVLILAGSIPVPTPAKLGLVEFAVMFMLGQFGLEDQALAFSYAITFHMIVDLPKVILGLVAVWRTNWRWQTVTSPNISQTS